MWYASEGLTQQKVWSAVQEMERIFRLKAAAVYETSETGGSSVMYKRRGGTDFYILHIEMGLVSL